MDTQQFQRIAKALADPRRFDILQHIAAAGDELCCGDIVECFPVAQPTISHHLKELGESGLIEIRREGQFKYFRTCPETIREYIEELRRRTGVHDLGPIPSRTAAKRDAVLRG